MNARYERNIGAITETEQELLGEKRAAVAGCGGLGCYTAEFLVRMGIGHLTLIDGDVFIPSNLNRQLNSMEINIGKNKAFETERILRMVRTDLDVKAVDAFITEENAEEILKDHDVIIDALDNVKTRLVLEKAASKIGIPLIHGAVEAWNIQLCTVFPGDFTLSMLYPSGREFERPSVLSFTPAFCASMQTAEAVKVLLNRGNIFRKKLFTGDLKTGVFETIELC